jgi:hypothetical protein
VARRVPRRCPRYACLLLRFGQGILFGILTRAKGMAENRVELGALIRKLFEDIEHRSRMSHAAIVLVAGSMVESQLVLVLSTTLMMRTPRISKYFFGVNGPLSSFANKIEFAYALDLISKDMRDALHAIRNLRNAFAHATEFVNFHSPQIKPLFDALRKPEGTKGTMPEVFLACIQYIADDLNRYG